MVPRAGRRVSLALGGGPHHLSRRLCIDADVVQSCDSLSRITSGKLVFCQSGSHVPTCMLDEPPPIPPTRSSLVDSIEELCTFGRGHPRIITSLGNVFSTPR